MWISQVVCAWIAQGCFLLSLVDSVCTKFIVDVSNCLLYRQLVWISQIVCRCDKLFFFIFVPVQSVMQMNISQTVIYSCHECIVTDLCHCLYDLFFKYKMRYDLFFIMNLGGWVVSGVGLVNHYIDRLVWSGLVWSGIDVSSRLS